MFDARRKSTGIGHTARVTLLIAAFMLSLAVLSVSRPIDSALFSPAMACMTVNVLAHSRSQQTIGTVE